MLLTSAVPVLEAAVVAATTPPTTPTPESPDTPGPTLGTSGSMLDWLVGTPLRIFLIVAIALVARFLWQRLVTSSVNGMTRTAGMHERISDRKVAHALDEVMPSERRQQRSEAVGALLRSIGAAVIFTIATVMVLQELGIDLGPIVAGAGIAGIALGFGAQSLVRDFLSGVLMILEDQYGVGDVIDTGFVIGEVEDVGLRVTRVRDVNGIVWYVRNGEVLRIGNRSQGWATAIADIPVAYDEDLDRVRALVDGVGDAMFLAREFTEHLLDPPRFVGVESVAGDAVTVRITARTAPQQQLMVAREIRERVKAAFDAEGVRVPAMQHIVAAPPPPTAP